MNKKKSIYWRVLLILIGLTVIMALMGLNPALCDWYTDNIYGYLCDGMSRITALFPVALGELMMYLGVLMLLLNVIFLVLLIFLRKKTKYRKFCAGYFKTFLMMLVSIVFIYIPTWFVPFRGTVLGKGNTDLRTDFSYYEVYELLVYIVDGANAAAEEIEMDESGSVQFATAEENLTLIAEAMRSLEGEYPRLSGYYPPVKTALCSDILDRMGIGGYNYPFTMEPTHSKYVSPTYQPILDAHELAHHKGYYKENEANFLSQLALSQSKDPLLRLSGYMDMYDYVFEEYLYAREEVLMEMIINGEIPDPMEMTDEQLEEYREIFFGIIGEEPCLSERVFSIQSAGRIIEQEIYEADEHPIDEMPVVDEVITETADVGWETQGEILQENTYEGVSLLLLQHFDGKLY